jgi:hypothetical protein
VGCWEGRSADLWNAEDADSGREGSKESESSRESGEVRSEQLAPKKKPRQIQERSLRQELGFERTQNYKKSSSYTGRGAGRPEGVTQPNWRYFEYTLYLIEECTAGGPMRENRIAELRERIHVMEVETKYNNPVLIKASGILERARGLPRLLDPELNDEIPWDIVADARALYDRWKAEKYDSSILRGILIDKKAKGISYKSDPEYLYQRVPAAVIGHNGLVNGQWWPIRQGTLRDGAHGEVEAGIAGKAGKGVFSIVMSNGGYADKDDGDVSFPPCTTSTAPLIVFRRPSTTAVQRPKHQHPQTVPVSFGQHSPDIVTRSVFCELHIRKQHMHQKRASDMTAYTTSWMRNS